MCIRLALRVIKICRYQVCNRSLISQSVYLRYSKVATTPHLLLENMLTVCYSLLLIGYRSIKDMNKILTDCWQITSKSLMCHSIAINDLLQYNTALSLRQGRIFVSF